MMSKVAVVCSNFYLKVHHCFVLKRGSIMDVPQTAVIVKCILDTDLG